MQHEELVFAEVGFEEEVQESTLCQGSDSRTTQILRFYVKFLFLWPALFRISDAGMGVLFGYGALTSVVVCP